MRFNVIIKWPCRAVVSVEARSKEEAEEQALEAGLPWGVAEEDDDGASTSAVAHVPGCPAVTRQHEACRCGEDREGDA